MSEEITIDQVIVRKAGGYNLRTVDWWKGLSLPDRHDLLAKGDVQFFASGTEVPNEEAVTILDAGTSASTVRHDAPIASTGPVEIPAFSAAPDAATYTRRVVAGPRWQVTRRDEHGEVELHTRYGHDDPSVYDLATSRGATQLSNDLLADALGAPVQLVAEHPEAFAHFQAAVFDLHLGNRPWEVVAGKIRGSLASNPHLRIAATAPAS
ncbi:MAG: hypothetical protein AB8G14_10625 [Ilumatobacter sp.]